MDTHEEQSERAPGVAAFEALTPDERARAALRDLTPIEREALAQASGQPAAQLATPAMDLEIDVPELPSPGDKVRVLRYHAHLMGIPVGSVHAITGITNHLGRGYVRLEGFAPWYPFSPIWFEIVADETAPAMGGDPCCRRRKRMIAYEQNRAACAPPAVYPYEQNRDTERPSWEDGPLGWALFAVVLACALLLLAAKAGA